MKRAYVTGCAGFLGAAVTRKLYEQGWTVAGCDNLHTGIPARLDGVAGTFEWAPISQVDPPAVDVIVHTGAIARSMWPDSDAIWRNNVDATRIVCGWGLPIVHASSSMVAHPDANVYCKSKEVAEWFVLRNRGTALRFGNIWGDGQSEHLQQPNVIAAFRRQAQTLGKVLVEGDGSQTRDFVHVDDAADAMVTAATSHRWAVADICTGHQTSILSIAEQVAAKFGVPVEFVPGRRNDPYHVVQDPAKAIEYWCWKASRIGVRL